MAEARDFSEAIASLASLCSLPPSAKTVHRTVFFRKPLAFSLLVRIPFYKKKNHHHKGSDFIFGGEQGISPRLLPLSPRFARCHRRQKTVHRTVFFRKALPFSLLVRIPFHYKKTKPPERMALFFCGGEQGIFPRLSPLSPRFARCHRRQKQSTGLFSSERLCLSPSLFESLFIIKKQNHPNGWLCFFVAESKGFEPSNRL